MSPNLLGIAPDKNDLLTFLYTMSSLGLIVDTNRGLLVPQFPKTSPTTDAQSVILATENVLPLRGHHVGFTSLPSRTSPPRRHEVSSVRKGRRDRRESSVLIGGWASANERGAEDHFRDSTSA